VATSKAKALDRLQKSLEVIPTLRKLRSGSQEFTKWHRDTEIAIANTFGETARHVKDFTDIRYRLMAFSSVTTDSAWENAYQRGLDRAESVLQSMIDEIREYWDDEQAGAQSSGQLVVDVESNQTDVFVVHGRDGEAKEAVARFLSNLGLSPIVLHEQPNEGRTIIEKFERNARVGFAVVLLTPDDIGGLPDAKPSLLPRARQNVVLELGYFMGRLGRDRVCALVKEGVELPSDIAGVVYVPLDIGGAWKMALVRELKACGFEVDANLAL